MAEASIPTTEKMQVSCCIAGGGPAGMMLGFLLARAGVEVVVLEKHGDFLRDFRGDTIHPSTLELLHELGILDEFLKRPHQEATTVNGRVGGHEFPFADFSHLPTHCRFIAFMPQWDFLNFLTEQARRYPTFHLKMRAEVTELLEEGGRVQGVRARTPQGLLEVRATLVVGADGRRSTVRQRAALKIEDLGAPIDVLWMRISRSPEDPQNPLGNFDRGRVFVMLDRSDYWQCAFVIPKGGFDEVRRQGLESLRQNIVAIAPFLGNRVGELQSWEDIHLLTVTVDRLRRWYRPGLLCIGDAAHAMSPIGGVGINLAIQDAVAAANLLETPLREHRCAPTDLQKVQRRREWPTRLTQGLQVFIQNRVIGRVLGSRQALSLPWPLRLLRRFPLLRRLPARASSALGSCPNTLKRLIFSEQANERSGFRSGEDATLPRIVKIDGRAFRTLEEFFKVIGEALIPGEKWGENLDAFNDILCWPYDRSNKEPYVLVWRHSNWSRRRLNHAAAAWYWEQVIQSGRSGKPNASQAKQLALAERCQGPTAFDWIVEIIEKHPDWLSLRLE